MQAKDQLEDSFLVRNLYKFEEVSVVRWKVSAFKIKIKSYLLNDSTSIYPIHFHKSQIGNLSKIIRDSISAKPIVLKFEMTFG